MLFRYLGDKYKRFLRFANNLKTFMADDDLSGGALLRYTAKGGRGYVELRVGKKYIVFTEREFDVVVLKIKGDG